MVRWFPRGRVERRKEGEDANVLLKTVSTDVVKPRVGVE